MSGNGGFKIVGKPSPPEERLVAWAELCANCISLEKGRCKRSLGKHGQPVPASIVICPLWARLTPVETIED